MDWYARNYFDILDDDNDPDDFTSKELNRYFLEGHLEVMMDTEEEMIEDESFTEQSETEPFQHNKEDQVLSQKLSQLSTKTEGDIDNEIKNAEEEQDLLEVNKKRSLHTVLTPDVASTRVKTITDDQNHKEKSVKDTEPIPTYLSLTSESFNHLMKNLLGTTDTIRGHDLQYIALRIHRLGALHIQKQVSMIYFQSGTGTLREHELELVPVDKRVWPAQVKAEMLNRRAANTTDMNTNPEDEQLAYENLVHQRLEEYNQQTDQYQKDLDEKKSSLLSFTSTMEESIRKYVYQYGICPLKLLRDLKIALLKHDYDAEIIERKFLQEKPNEYQIQTAKHLYEARNELEKTKRNLLELKQRVFYNKPPISYDTMQTSTELLSSTTTNDHEQQQLLNQQEKFIRQKKLDRMALEIMKVERKFHHCQQLFIDELSTMWQNHRQLIKDKGMSTSLSDLIERRFTNIVDRWRDIYLFRIFYHVQAPYGDWEALQQENKKKQTNVDEQPIRKIMTFHSPMIIHAQHSFTEQQLQLLHRGPIYVPPCQIHVASLTSSLEDIVKKQYAPLKHQLACLFSKYAVNVALQFTIQEDIYDSFKKFFLMSLPSDLKQRACDEQRLIQIIRQELKNNNLILRRTADNMNTFYLGDREEFERKANEYLTTTDQYNAFSIINKQMHEQPLQSQINELIEYINDALDILRRRNDIDANLHKRLRLDASKVKLPYLYFLPNVSQKNDVTLIPMVTCQRSVTYKISKYLDQLLRPFAQENMASVTFHDEIDFIQKLNAYVHTEHRLTSTTMFCTIQVINYSALDSHETMIDVVCNFIHNHVAANKLHKISIATIKNFLQLSLYHNIFSYKNNIYTFAKGGPTTLPLMNTLANIYMHVCQKDIISELEHNKELFGRYKDQIFFTWNGFENELEHILEIFRQKRPQVRLRTVIGRSVPFLNAYIANRDGQLYTRVYHDPTIPAYTLPYVVGHSKVNHSDWLRTALLRAVCYSSSVNDFNQERIYLVLTCLISGYSLQFVDSRVSHFFDYFQASAVRYSTDQVMYDKFRRQCFDFKDMQRAFSSNLQHSDDNGHLIHFHYRYEFGARCQFNEEFRQLWIKHFDTHPTLSTKKTSVLLTTKHLHSLNALLAQ